MFLLKKVVRCILLSIAVTLLLWNIKATAEDNPQKILDSRNIDNFDTIQGWQAITAEGTQLDITQEKGFKGNSLCLNYDLGETRRYVIASKEISLALPPNYEFIFFIKGNGPDNNLEFKLIDDKENTFWVKWENLKFSGERQKITVRKEDIAYAWGPVPGAELEKVKKIEFAISAGSGGKGRVFIDELTLTVLPEVRYSKAPEVEAEEKIETQEFAVTGSAAWQAPAPLRKEVSLNGLWKYSADPQRTGEESGYFKPDADTSKWRDMKVPGNWATENPDMFNYGGKVWFQRQFTPDKEVLSSDVIRLRFAGVDYFAKVWLNGHYLGEHEGYFNPFDFEVKKYLNPDSVNVLTVCVDSPKEPNFEKKKLVKGILIHHDCRPPDNKGNTGGIWNDVKLIGTDWIYIESVIVRPELNENLTEAKIYFRCFLNNISGSQEEAEIKITFGGKNFQSEKTYLQKEVSVKPGKSEIVLVASLKNPMLWWTWDHGKSNLYEADIFVESGNSISDDKKVAFGIRKIGFDQGKKFFYLNGKRIFQRGTNYIATQWLSTFKKEDFERDVQMMKDANLNSVRNHAHVMPQEFYTACDEKGLLVWADFALIWVYIEDESFIRQARKQFKEYIRGYYNHPSIWLWCAHNEGGLNVKLNKTLYEEGRKLDSLRIINEDSGSWDKHPYHGWYDGKYEDFLSDHFQFLTEYGAQGIPLSFEKFISKEAQWPPRQEEWRYHNSQFDFQEYCIGRAVTYNNAKEFAKASLIYQYDLIKFATEEFRRSKYSPTGGIYQFMFTEDWPSITWAVVDFYRDPKPAYYALKEAMSPVLVSIRWEKHFFEPGKSLEASLWAVNDYLYPIRDCALSYNITDAAGKKSFQSDTIKLDLKEDSSVKVKDILFNISADAKESDIYRLSAELKDSAGKTLSANYVLFRIGGKDEFLRDLSGRWLFKTGDDILYAGTDLNEEGWVNINAPGSWESQGHGNYDGFAWYRKHIEIPKNWKQKNIILRIGNIDDCDEVYLNGVKINGSGSLPPKYKTACGRERFYTVPRESIKFGESNLIAIRVFDNGGDGGIVSSPVQLGDLDSIKRKYIPVYSQYTGIE